MASLTQVYNIRFQSSDLRKRITAALALKANSILQEVPVVTARVKWANKCLRNTPETLEKILWRVAFDSVVAEKGEAATDSEVIAAIGAIVESDIATDV